MVKNKFAQIYVLNVSITQIKWIELQSLNLIFKNLTPLNFMQKITYKLEFVNHAVGDLLHHLPHSHAWLNKEVFSVLSIYNVN